MTLQEKITAYNITKPEQLIGETIKAVFELDREHTIVTESNKFITYDAYEDYIDTNPFHINSIYYSMTDGHFREGRESLTKFLVDNGVFTFEECLEYYKEVVAEREASDNKRKENHLRMSIQADLELAKKIISEL